MLAQKNHKNTYAMLFSIVAVVGLGVGGYASANQGGFHATVEIVEREIVIGNLVNHKVLQTIEVGEQKRIDEAVDLSAYPDYELLVCTVDKCITVDKSAVVENGQRLTVIVS